MDGGFLSYSPESVIKDTCRTLAGHEETRCFSGPSTQCYVVTADSWIVLAWRGTQVDGFWASVVDWLTDARFLPVADEHGDLVHAGFHDAIGQVWSNVATHIAEQQRRKQRALWITGHSLGAALATLAANRCSDRPDLHLVGTYTYGSPRVGDAAFGHRITTPLYRFQNNTDLVTHLPVGLIYRHVGHKRFIDTGGHLHRDESALHLLSALDPVLMKPIVETLRDPSQRVGIVSGVLADHAPINYATLIWNCYDAARAGV